MLDEELVKIFSHPVGCCFILVMVPFALEKLFSFMRSHVLIIVLSTCAISILFRKLFSVLMHSRLFSTTYSITFSGSGFVLRSLICLDLIFMQGER